MLLSGLTQDFSSLGITHVYQHNLVFLVRRVINVDESFDIFVKPCDELWFQSITVSESFKMWVQFKDVPLTYSSKHGLFQIANAIGKPVKLDGSTNEAIENCTPRHYVIVLVEVMPFLMSSLLIWTPMLRQWEGFRFIS